MATRKPIPLQDRLLSLSPDPIKSSILRESGMGWAAPAAISMPSSSGSGSVTSPLRIAKRDSPVLPQGPNVVRRTSSSFKHVRNNNLVSKSPFKKQTQTPTPSTSSRPISVAFPTRRVSGEKRARPSSMHEDAEADNDRPFSLKRDRKQSVTFQGLLEREPVTKSPFKQRERVSSMDDAPPSPSFPEIRYPSPSAAPISSIASRLTPIDNVTPTSGTGPSPGRSSLAPKRVRGPRLSGEGKRERRKTVTFDERCDVVEFDRETSEEEYWGDSDDEADHHQAYQDNDEIDPFFCGDHAVDDLRQSEPNLDLAIDTPELSMEEVAPHESTPKSGPDSNPSVTTLLDRDTSINGLVEEMIFSSNAALVDADLSGSKTPPRVFDIPTDLETEDGVPFGRSHHAERLSRFHHQDSPQHNQPPLHFSPHARSPSEVVTNPLLSPVDHNSISPNNIESPTYSSSRRSFITLFGDGSELMQSTPPPGQSMNAEKIINSPEQVEEMEEMEEMGDSEPHAERLPVSPTPMKTARSSMDRSEGFIPKFRWPRGSQYPDRGSPSSKADAFDFDEHNRSSNGSLDPSNLSIGNSEVSLSGLDKSVSYHSGEEAPPESDLSNSSFLKNDPPQGYIPSPAVSNTSPEEVLAGINEAIDRSVSKLSPSSLLPGVTSPPIPVTSPLNLSQSSNSSRALSPHHRISKDDIRRRLTEKRSTLSASPEPRRPFNAVMGRIEPSNESLSQDVIPHPQRPPTIGTNCDKERDCISISTAMTDVSLEPATVQRAERMDLAGSLPTPDSLSDKEFGVVDSSPSLQITFGNKFTLGGMGIRGSDTAVHSKGSPALSTRGNENDDGSVHSGSNVKMGGMDVNMDMKSALDRLMDDVAGAGGHEDSMITDEEDTSYDQSAEIGPRGIHRAATDSDLMHITEASGGMFSRSLIPSIPPPLPPKDNQIKAREQLILEKRREARRAEGGHPIPARSNGQRLQAKLGVGRPSRRRSLSADDANDHVKKRLDQLPNIGNMEQLIEEDPLSQSIERELKKLRRNPSVAAKSKYQVREHESTIYASAPNETVSHVTGVGDVDTGKAWKTVRRPSDMDEYSKQIKEYRLQASPGKSYGKVFVKVLGIKGVNIALPQEPTTLTCTLNNGIHFVTTPECPLAPDCRIDQEFELIEHSKLEFTLTLKIRKDPHIVAQFKELTSKPTPAPPPPPPPVQQSSSRGMRSFFSSSPKKPSKEKRAQTPPPPLPTHRLPENLARYLKPDGTLARAFIQFKDIAPRCDMRLFETSYPLIGQRVESAGKLSTLQVGEIILQIFRLPPLPGIPPEQLPQSLEECHRGLRHINWHKMTYFQGTLTQSGGDCNTWRRRLFRVIGAKLVAFNDVTKKATATIDLKKAIAVQDDQDLRNPLSPLAQRRGYDEDALYGVERSFRLIFPQEQEIIFFADTDEEKVRWLEVLRALVGHIPPHPIWAELLWQRQEDMSKWAVSPR